MVVGRTTDPTWAARRYVGVDHGRGDITVAEQGLDHAQILPAFEQVRGEGMAQGMRGGLFEDAGLLHCAVIHGLDVAGVGVVTLVPCIVRVDGHPRAGEDPLPDPGGGQLIRPPWDGPWKRRFTDSRQPDLSDGVSSGL